MYVGIHTWALDVPDDAAGGVVHELDADLGHASTGAWSISESCLHDAHSRSLAISNSHIGTIFTYQYVRELQFCQW